MSGLNLVYMSMPDESYLKAELKCSFSFYKLCDLFQDFVRRMKYLGLYVQNTHDK